jgi:hypothetical protein
MALDAEGIETDSPADDGDDQRERPADRRL